MSSKKLSTSLFIHAHSLVHSFKLTQLYATPFRHFELVASKFRFSSYERYIVKRILAAIDKASKENDIEYFLYGETLLGYLRYNDVNPWINRVEVALPKSEFFKLAQLVIQDVRKL